jgi:DNA polymerase III epsilon subunit-like protein
MTKKTKNNEAAEKEINPKMSPIMDKLGEILGITFKTVQAAPKPKNDKTIKSPLERWADKTQKTLVVIGLIIIIALVLDALK